jgi:hypothetical protein
MIKEYQLEILTSSLDARKKEITEYQVNIDNFRLAIEEIGDDEQLQEFKNQINELLTANIIEQRKAQIMLTVIQKQLEQ